MTTNTKKRLLLFAWLMWGTAMLPQFLNFFHRIAGTTIADRLMADFNITATAVGALMAVLFYVYGAMQFPAGALADSLGPRKTLTIGSIIAGIGAITFGLAPTLSVLFIGRILISLGISVSFVSVLKTATVWFSSRAFGFMTALFQVLSQVGGILATTPLALLVISVGWQTSYQLVGLVSLVVAVICWLVIRNHPKDVGLPSPAELERQQAGTPEPSSPTPGFTLSQRMKMVLSNRYTWASFMIGSGIYGTFFTFTGAWGVPYMMQVYDMTRSTAASFMLLINLGVICGSLFIAYFTNTVLKRRKLPGIVSTIGYLFTWLLLTFLNPGNLSPQILGGICFSLGFFAGYLGQNLAYAKEVNHPSASGIALGVVNMGPFLFTGVLQPLFGKILDMGWQGVFLGGARAYPVEAFHTGFILISGVAAIAAIAALLLKETRCRNLIT